MGRVFQSFTNEHAMSTIYKWIGPIPMGKIKAYSWKKDMPKPLLGYLTVRVDFGLYGIAYVYVFNNKIVCPGGEDLEVFMACLRTPGFVIGLRLDNAAQHKPWADEWRGAFHERNLERLEMPFKR